jgi:hypothetical protein
MYWNVRGAGEAASPARVTSCADRESRVSSRRALGTPPGRDRVEMLNFGGGDFVPSAGAEVFQQYPGRLDAYRSESAEAAGTALVEDGSSDRR